MLYFEEEKLCVIPCMPTVLKSWPYICLTHDVFSLVSVTANRCQEWLIMHSIVE